MLSWPGWLFAAWLAYTALEAVGKYEFEDPGGSYHAPAPGAAHVRELTGAHVRWVMPTWPRRKAPRAEEEPLVPRALRFFQHPGLF